MTDWTPEIVFARLVEAGDIEWRMPAARLGPSASPGFWPGYTHTYGDMVEWGTKRLAEEREMRSKRLPPSAAEITRWEEVIFDWHKSRMPEGDRTLLRGYVQSVLRGRSFSKWCDKRGLNRRTAYRRIAKALERLAANLCRSNVFLRMPDLDRVSQLTPGRGISPIGSDEPRSHGGWRSPGTELTDNPEARDLDWAREQNERRRRKLLNAEREVA
ncbi:hypothetical protein [Methylopila sp. Yamaguchi]|uniref:hypothetical protein n=1 Tax=Methylopila sp. Yamaguchi TaxID=1437817 RepID=UPI000CAEBD23|nr:hypothetical protein [Methylopila sp. Yamaguchi]GBD48081.1 hypothetical protein METY_1294 [Methylopila sp. Yamaguchi]